jgi:hypothetical protein
MRKNLRIASLFLALLVLGFWFIRGHNTGWTKNKVFHPVQTSVSPHY